MPTYTFTLTATFDAATFDEAWNDWLEWVADPRHVEDGSVVATDLNEDVRVMSHFITVYNENGVEQYVNVDHIRWVRRHADDDALINLTYGSIIVQSTPNIGPDNDDGTYGDVIDQIARTGEHAVEAVR